MTQRIDRTTTEYKLRNARKKMTLYDAPDTIGRKIGARGWYFSEPKWDLGEFDFEKNEIDNMFGSMSEVFDILRGE